ncbi:MAG: hypothetical protein Q7T55_26875 [Solirubrobacteraceae bacterium]|nr:hypothetical protein [Solirubrobacteraceae bacterium]
MDAHEPQQPTGGAPLSRSARASFREAAAWGLTVVITLGAAVCAAAGGVILAVFGLSGAAAALAGLLIVVGASVWRRGLLPVAVVSVTLTLGATWAADSENRLDRSTGTMVVEPRTPSDLRAGPYRLGIGGMLMDLRRFRAPDGSTSRIAARTDAGRLVVALPTDRCFNLRVRFREEPTGPPATFALRVMRGATGRIEPTDVSMSSMGFTRSAIAGDSQRSGAAALRADEAGETTLPYGLLAFNRWAYEAGRYERVAAGEPGAPTLDLDLRSTQQMVIRSYPVELNPLSLVFDPLTGLPRGGIAWPEGLAKPAPPDTRGRKALSIQRTPENRARWIAWEGQMIAWAKAHAKRAAGPCASRDEVRARGFSFLTQPESVRTGGRTDRLLASGRRPRSSIPQRTVDAPDTMLSVEVDGLGHTTLGRDQRRIGSGESTRVTP